MKFMLAFLLISFPAGAQTVISGDTINLNGTVFRLWGIYAPEIGQNCANGWPAGKVSAEHLGALIQGHLLNCEPMDAEHPGPRRAICKADNQDVAAGMVSAGMAWARLSDGQSYVVQEANAMSGFLGVHGHECSKIREVDKRRGANQ